VAGAAWLFGTEPALAGAAPAPTCMSVGSIVSFMSTVSAPPTPRSSAVSGSPVGGAGWEKGEEGCEVGRREAGPAALILRGSYSASGL